MKLLPPYQPPDSPLVTKAQAIQLAWERESLFPQAKKLERKGWKLIGSKGTSSIEYQKVYVEFQTLSKRINEIDNLLKLYQEE